jgi:hypothetical protein
VSRATRRDAADKKIGGHGIHGLDMYHCLLSGSSGQKEGAVKSLLESVFRGFDEVFSNLDEISETAVLLPRFSLSV